MNQQQPQQPWNNQPQPQQWAAPAPQPPKKGKGGKIALGIIGGFIGLIVIAAVAGGGEEEKTPKADSSNSAPAKDDKPAAEQGEPAADKEDKPKPALSQADEFKAFISKDGTPAEKSAVKHVIKVTGADERNDILDAAEVFTDLSGDMFGPNASTGKLIASAFASWKDSDNGLVTVYNDKGEMLSNGNY